MELSKKYNLEHALYLLVLVAAVLLRFWNLGGLPLTETEAVSALSAHQIAAGQDVTATGFQSGYTILTAMLFFIFHSSTFLARFLPALLGSAVVLFPWLYRKQLGRISALALAAGLAIDPLLVHASRTAGSDMLGIFAVLGLLTAVVYRRPMLAGIMATFVLLGAPASLVGLTAFVLFLLLLRILRLQHDFDLSFFNGEKLREFLMAGGIGLVLISTLFLTQPAGLSWLAANFWQFFQGWIVEGADLWKMLAAFPAYFLLPMLFGLSSLICGLTSGNRRIFVLGTAALAVLVTAFFFPGPGRQVTDLVWLGIILWILSALEIGRVIASKKENKTVFLFQFVLTLVTGIFLFLNLASFSLLILELKHHLTILGILVFMIISVGLIMFSWAKEAALKGFSLAMLVLLAFFSVHAAWTGNQKTERYINELWHKEPVVLNAGLINSTVEDLSLMVTGTKDEIEILYQVESIAFRWLMRDFPNAQYVHQVNASAFPDLLFTGGEVDAPFLAAAYRGQSFDWLVHSAGNFGIRNNAYNWFLFRDTAPYYEELILWARVDLFPDGDIIDSQSETKTELNFDEYEELGPDIGE